MLQGIRELQKVSRKLIQSFFVDPRQFSQPGEYQISKSLQRRLIFLRKIRDCSSYLVALRSDRFRVLLAERADLLLQNLRRFCRRDPLFIAVLARDSRKLLSVRGDFLAQDPFLALDELLLLLKRLFEISEPLA